MRLLKLLCILGILTLAVSCEKKEPVKNDEAKLLGITLPSGNGVLDTANNKITLKVPETVDLTKIVPHFNISPNATIYPPSDVATDYTNPVVYTITSEDKTGQYVFTVSAFKPVARFTVYDCSNWTPTENSVLQAGAVIKIYSDQGDVNTTKTYDVLTTDQSGKADFYGVKGTIYFITVNKDNKSNIVNGYILDGRYNSQAEVDNAFDTNATIGGFRYKDINGDGRVWPDDKYNYDWLAVPEYITGVRSIDLYIAAI
jgi:hypothetical protein